MNYGFIIDTRSCIGCHACSTACKSENQVPLGVHRTWVKYTEHGSFPDVTRSFQVTRCNHCSNPPCVRICPVTAMYQRTDGIVEFDSDVCIGCKACMQACPYDAIYVDPESGTAAKCHFCGHRVENGLEPACVVVCPTHSIIAGDLDDPDSEISRVAGRNQLTVRKPEQGTAPKTFYISGDAAAMVPTAAERPSGGMMFSEVVPQHGKAPPAYGSQKLYEVHLQLEDMEHHGPPAGGGGTAASGAAIRSPGDQADPAGGPVQVAPGRMAEQMVQSAWNAQHKLPWHWPVPAYLVTKGMGAGIFLLLAVALLMGMPVSAGTVAWAGGLGVLMTLLTTVLLVADLERPERFLSILTRPQWKSWLTRGAFLLIGFSTVSGLWFAAGLGEAVGLLPGLLQGPVGLAFALLTLPLAVGAAIYTAFLFAQAEGRDLWQSPLLPVHLLWQALFMGGAGLLLVSPLGVLDPALVGLGTWALLGGLVLDAFFVMAELGTPHASEVAARAAHDITRGRFKTQLWWGAMVLGHLVPVALLLLGLATGSLLPGVLAALCATAGLYFYEHAFVMAPQLVPNS